MKNPIAVLFTQIILVFLIAACGTTNNSPDETIVNEVEAKQQPVKVFLLGGQSNMEGCGIRSNRPEAYNTHPNNIVTWDDYKMKWVALETDSFAVERDSLFGPEIGFSHLMAKQYPNHTIAIVKTAGGGTTLWNHWAPDGFMYGYFVEAIEGAIKELNDSGADYEIAGMLWMQGETDSEIKEKAIEYEQNLEVLIENVRELTGNKELPFVMGRITSSLLKETPWNFDYTEYTQQSQENVAAHDTNVFIINTDHLTTWADNTHFDAPSQIWLGNRMGEVMLKRME